MEQIGAITAGIIGLAALLGARAAIGKYVRKIAKWIDEQEEQEKDIKKLKEEQCLIVYGTLACLKGLKEQGCNGPVTDAIKKLEKHINVEAHK